MDFKLERGACGYRYGPCSDRSCRPAIGTCRARRAMRKEPRRKPRCEAAGSSEPWRKAGTA